MQNVINRVQVPNTAAHYALRQLEPQVVKIKSEEPKIYVSVPGLEQRFKDIKDAQGNQNDLVYYAVKAFRIQNSFHNVKAKDRMCINIHEAMISRFKKADGSLEYYYNDLDRLVFGYDDVYGTRWTPHFSNPGPPTPGDLSGNAHTMIPFFLPLMNELQAATNDALYLTNQQIVDNLNTNLQQLLFEMIHNNRMGRPPFYDDNNEAEMSCLPVQYTGTAPNKAIVDTQAKIMFLAQLQFINVMGKMMFKYNETETTIELVAPSEDYLRLAYSSYVYDAQDWTTLPTGDTYLTIYNTNQTYAIKDNSFLNEATIFFTPDPFMPNTDQDRLALLFGLEFENNLSIPNYIFTPTRQFLRLTTALVGKKSGAFILTKEKTHCLFARGFSQAVTRMDDICNQFNFASPWLKFSIGKMGSLNYDRINIHSSLRSNWTDAQGRRSDIIQTIDLDKNNNDQIVEYRPHYDVGREYSTQDNIASFKTFYVELRGVDATPVPTREVGGFELEIVLWFLPSDPALLQL